MSSIALKELLHGIRQHPGFKELLSTVEKPRIRPYQKKEADQIEVSRAQWIYESGQLAQHERWIAVLTGTQETT
jgi:hypothetical protein